MAKVLLGQSGNPTFRAPASVKAFEHQRPPRAKVLNLALSRRQTKLSHNLVAKPFVLDGYQHVTRCSTQVRSGSSDEGSALFSLALKDVPLTQPSFRTPHSCTSAGLLSHWGLQSCPSPRDPPLAGGVGNEGTASRRHLREPSPLVRILETSACSYSRTADTNCSFSAINASIRAVLLSRKLAMRSWWALLGQGGVLPLLAKTHINWWVTRLSGFEKRKLEDWSSRAHQRSAYAAQSSDSTSACFSTMSMAAAALSGGYL